MRLSLLLLVSLFYGFETYSQDFKLIKVDNESYPTIKLTVELSENLNILNLKIIEDGQKRLVKIDSVELYHGENAICYLIDINKFKKVERQIVFKALLNAASKIKPGTLINICFFQVKNHETCFTPLSYEFTDKAVEFVQFAKKISSQYPEKLASCDIESALENTITFIDKKENLPNQKTIIILTKGFNNSSKINKILAAGKDKNISIKILSHIADTLTIKLGNFYPLQAKPEEKELLNKLSMASNEKDLTNIDINKNYIIEFVSTQNDFSNRFELHYNDKIIKAKFINPGAEKFPGIIWFILIVLVLAIFIIFLIIKQIYLKRKLLNLKETVSLLFDKKMKILGKQTKTPVIEINLQDQIKNYHVKKLTTTIGRKKNCDILIDNLTISSHHASITNEGGEFYIQDHESTNGIFVNDIKVNKKTIKNGDIIRLGKAVLMIHY